MSTTSAAATTDFVCPSCGLIISVPSHLAGKSGKCRGCRKSVTIPAPEGDSEDVLDLKDDALADGSDLPGKSRPITAATSTPESSDSRFLKFTIIGAAAIILLFGGSILTIHLVSSSKEQRALTQLESAVSGLLSQATQAQDEFDFDSAQQSVKEAGDRISQAKAKDVRVLRDRTDKALEAVERGKRDYTDKLAQGYVHFEGRLISAHERDRVVANRRQEEQVRRIAVQRQKEEAQAKKSIDDFVKLTIGVILVGPLMEKDLRDLYPDAVVQCGLRIIVSKECRYVTVKRDGTTGLLRQVWDAPLGSWVDADFTRFLDFNTGKAPLPKGRRILAFDISSMMLDNVHDPVAHSQLVPTLTQKVRTALGDMSTPYAIRLRGSLQFSEAADIDEEVADHPTGDTFTINAQEGTMSFRHAKETQVTLDHNGDYVGFTLRRATSAGNWMASYVVTKPCVASGKAATEAQRVALLSKVVLDGVRRMKCRPEDMADSMRTVWMRIGGSTYPAQEVRGTTSDGAVQVFASFIHWRRYGEGQWQSVLVFLSCCEADLTAVNSELSVVLNSMSSTAR